MQCPEPEPSSPIGILVFTDWYTWTLGDLAGHYFLSLIGLLAFAGLLPSRIDERPQMHRMPAFVDEHLRP